MGAACGGHCGRIGVHPSRISCHGWPELLRKGVGVSPVNGGPGENELEPEGTCSRRRCESPPAAFCLLCRRGQRRSPHRAKPCETARRVVAPYERHGPQKVGRSGDPPVPRCGTFSRPPAGFWNGLVRRAPTRTRCHSWSEPGAAVKMRRPKFCTAPGPSGPEKSKPGTGFCAPELLRKGVGVSPVNRGPGENELEPEGTCSRRRCESPPAAFWFLFRREKRNSPKGRNPVRRRAESSRPTGVTAHGNGRVWDPPLQRLKQIAAEPDSGRGKPLPYGMDGETFLGGEPADGHMGRPLRRIPPARQIIQGNTVKVRQLD